MAPRTEMRSEALIDTRTLAGLLDDPSIAIVEVDEDTTAFDAGHIPGAVSLDWKSELHDLPRRDFVSASRLAELFGSKGVGNDQTIVFYGGNNNWFAAYAYWLCKLRGIDDVKLLDGGRTKWELEDRPFTVTRPDVEPADFEPGGSDRPELRATREEVIDFALNGGQMVDVRSPAEFTGEVMAPPHLPQEQPYVAGHIPGATNIPWSQAANDDGTFKSVEELRTLYGAAGITGSTRVVAY